MKTTNKILSIILAILMIISIIPITASATAPTSGTCGENVIWEFDDATKTLTISGTGEMYNYLYSNSPWNEYVVNIKTVIIEDGVTTVGDYAFYWHISITSVTIADSVTKIGEYAFDECQSLVNVTIGSGVETIGECAFGGCSNLFSITIPDSVTFIGKAAFANCNNLITAIIGNGVTVIDEYTFNQCYKLTIIAIPDSLTTIGKNAFRYCSNLNEIYYSGTVEQWLSISIDNSIDNNNEPIRNALFKKFNVEYPSVEFVSGICGENLTWTFDNSTGTLTISGTGAMDNYDDLTSCPWQNYKAAIRRIVINNSVTSIGSSAFYNCYNLTNITIPDSITSIGNDAFYNCYSLSSIIIPDDITRVSDGVFYNCYSLMNITIPNGLTSFGSNALSNCKNINNLYYCGTEDEWKEVVFESVYPQHPLKYATIHYNYCVHEYSTVVTPPTCTEQGYTTYTCECGDTYVDDYVDALGHTPAEPVQQWPANATCTEDGSIYEFVYCSVCDEEISRELIVIEATGHADNDGDGYCDECDEQLSENNDIMNIVIGFIKTIINFIINLLGIN